MIRTAIHAILITALVLLHVPAYAVDQPCAGFADLAPGAPLRKTLAPSVAKLATSHYVRLGAPVRVWYMRGDVVDVTYDKEKGLPESVAGIIVGSKGGPDAKTLEVIVDCGRGDIRTLPAGKIRTMARSKADVEPSTGSQIEGLKNLARNAAGHPLLAYFPVISYLAMGYYSWEVVVNGGILKGWDYLYDQSPTLTLLGTAGLVYSLFTTKVGRGAFHLLNDSLDLVSKHWYQPWKIVSGYGERNVARADAKTRDALGSLDNAVAQSRPMARQYWIPKLQEVGPSFLVDDQADVRVWAVLGKDDASQEQYLKDVRAAHQQAVEMRKYLNEIGAPAAKQKITIWAARDGLPGLDPNGKHKPNSMEEALAPFMGDKTPQVILVPKKPGDSVTEGAVYAKGVTREVVRMALPPTRRSEHLIEGISDYLVASKQNATQVAPEVKGNPYDSIGGLDGKNPESSQVVSRFLWKLREKLGREKADRIALLGLTTMGSPPIKPLSNILKGLGYVDTTKEKEDVYAYLASTAKALKAIPELREDFFEVAKAFGVPRQTLVAISEP